MESKSRTWEVFIVGVEGLLLCHRSQQLFHLNTSAAFILCCLDDGMDPTSIAQALSEEFAISLDVANKDVRAALTDWGFYSANTKTLDNGQPASKQHAFCSVDTEQLAKAATKQSRLVLGRVTKKGSTQSRRPVIEQQTGAHKAPHHSDSEAYHNNKQLICRLGQVNVIVRFPSANSFETARDVLAGFETASTSTTAMASVALDVDADNKGYALNHGGQCIARAETQDKLVPIIQREILIAAYHHNNCLVAVHAGAVCSDCACVLLPGAAGSGKSTLTAGLMHAGFAYLTDELVLVMPQTHLVQGLPTGIGLKQGSWALLQNRYPQVSRLATHRQADGTQVRYLVPTPSQVAKHGTAQATSLVFPVYQKGVRTSLIPLRTADSIARLARAGYAVKGGLTTCTVQNLIDWVGDLPCYELRIGDLDEAVAIVSQLLGREDNSSDSDAVVAKTA